MWFKPTLFLILVSANIPVYGASINKFKLSAGLQFENSDNILLAPVNPESDNIIHTLIQTEYEKKSSVLDTHLILKADDQNFQRNNSFDQTTISSIFSFISTLSKQHIFWDLRNRFDRIQVNQILANLPTNQENTNYFATGPRLVFFENDKHSFNMGFQYENFYTQKTNLDYYGGIFNLTYNRNITRLVSLGLTGKYNKRKFKDQSLGADNSRTDIIATLTKKLKVSQIKIDFGKTTVNQDAGNETDEDLYGFKYEYKHGDKEQINLSFKRELTDFSTAFSTSTLGEQIFTSANATNYLLKQGEFTFVRNFGLSSIRYRYLYQDNDYSNNLQDLITKSSTISLEHKITTSISFHLNGIYSDLKFPGIDRRDINRIYFAGVRKTFLNAYDITFSAQYMSNSSSDLSHIYTERRINLGGNYHF